MLEDTGPNVFRVLYRSVSPWEMANILATREVRGRGGAFASDNRRDTCHTWFADSIAPIIHSGEDYLRYTQGLAEWEPVHHAIETLYRVEQEADAVMEAQRAGWEESRRWMAPVDPQVRHTHDAAYKLRKQLGDAWRKAIYELAKQARTSAAKSPRIPTSYVLHLHDMPGGTMYADRDSRQSGAVEVCFPLEDAHELYEHIAGVDLIKGVGREEPVTIGHMPGDQIEQLDVPLPRMQQRTINTMLNLFHRLQPKLAQFGA